MWSVMLNLVPQNSMTHQEDRNKGNNPKNTIFCLQNNKEKEKNWAQWKKKIDCILRTNCAFYTLPLTRNHGWETQNSVFKLVQDKETWNKNNSTAIQKNELKKNGNIKTLSNTQKSAPTCFAFVLSTLCSLRSLSILGCHFSEDGLLRSKAWDEDSDADDLCLSTNWNRSRRVGRGREGFS